MVKLRHEVRDCLYGFIEFNNFEKQLIDSAPFQRLRHIHQLAMCYQVYPSATHKRFEHSLGVMEIATRIFDSLFRDRLADSVQERIEEELTDERKKYWRNIIRIGALLHDIGHLPFSHAAEEALLPAGWNHERLTAEMIRHSGISEILRGNIPPLNVEDVVAVAWDFEKRSKVEPDIALDPWRTLLNEIICGNTFGADRIDYLLRDSRHLGVAYGNFDPYRLISGLRVLVDNSNDLIAIGMDIGAIHAAEALLLARYFMYTQVYFHDVRRVYDLHLREFLEHWLPGGKFPSNWTELLAYTDNEVLAALHKAAQEPNNELYNLAKRLVSRGHFRTVYELVSTHKQKRPTILDDLRKLAEEQFGAERIRFDRYGPKTEANNFPVLLEDGGQESSLRVSGVIAQIPRVEFGLIFAAPDVKNSAKKMIDREVKTVSDGPNVATEESRR